MQRDNVTLELSSKISDLFHLLSSRCSRFRWNETDRLRNGWNVRVALSLEPAKNGRQLDVQLAESSEEPLRIFRSPCCSCRRMKLDRRDSQFVGDFEFYA